MNELELTDYANAIIESDQDRATQLSKFFGIDDNEHIALIVCLLYPTNTDEEKHFVNAIKEKINNLSNNTSASEQLVNFKRFF